jgi:hypothetical protein
MTAWGVQGGIQRNMPWFSLDKLGETAFWGGFEDVRDGFAQGSSAASGTTPLIEPVNASAIAASKLGGFPANGTFGASAFPGVLPACPPKGPKNCYQVVGTDVPMSFLALDQSLASAAMHVYFVYQHFSEPEFNAINNNQNHSRCRSRASISSIWAGGCTSRGLASAQKRKSPRPRVARKAILFCHDSAGSVSRRVVDHSCGLCIYLTDKYSFRSCAPIVIACSGSSGRSAGARGLEWIAMGIARLCAAAYCQQP